MKNKDVEFVVEPVPLERAVQEAYKMGIKEVVDFVEREEPISPPIFLELYRLIEEEEWQAQKKKWGIE